MLDIPGNLDKQVVQITEAGHIGFNSQYKKGKVLLWQGDRVRSVLVIKQGMVKIVSISCDKKIYTYGIVGKGGLMGNKVMNSIDVFESCGQVKTQSLKHRSNTLVNNYSSYDWVATLISNLSGLYLFFLYRTSFALRIERYSAIHLQVNLGIHRELGQPYYISPFDINEFLIFLRLSYATGVPNHATQKRQ